MRCRPREQQNNATTNLQRGVNLDIEKDVHAVEKKSAFKSGSGPGISIDIQQNTRLRQRSNAFRNSMKPTFSSVAVEKREVEARKATVVGANAFTDGTVSRKAAAVENFMMMILQ